MRRDPFENQPDFSDLPKCIACISYFAAQTPWRDPEGKIIMKCGNPDRQAKLKERERKALEN